jgi:hypothetical protein
MRFAPEYAMAGWNMPDDDHPSQTSGRGDD